MPLPPTLIKNSNESRLYDVNFSARLATGETLSSPTVSSSPTGLTVGSPVVSNGIVQFRLSGGTAGTTYTISVVVSTSNGNTLSACVKLLVQSCGYLDEMLTMLRYLIFDLDSTPTYSDTRLAQLLIVGASYVVQEIDFNTSYSVNVQDISISPDPVSDRDFMNLVVLKAACIADQSTFRTKAVLEGIQARCGPATMAVRGHIQGFRDLVTFGPCKAYDTLREQWMFGDNVIVEAILSPFVSNNYDPLYNQAVPNRARDVFYIQ